MLEEEKDGNDKTLVAHDAPNGKKKRVYLKIRFNQIGGNYYEN